MTPLALLAFLISTSILPPPVYPLAPPLACDLSSSQNFFIFCNRTLSSGERAEDVISRLSLQEKISQLNDIAPSVDRLGIPAYKWWSESLHGLSFNGRGIDFRGTIPHATAFPPVIHTAATFNPRLWYRIPVAIADEARAFYNAGQAQGLTFWAPNINIFRDPRWGRGQETPGEDPTLTSKYAISYVRGLQGDSYEGGKSEMLKVSACCKHFTAYDLENWNEYRRDTFNATVSKQDLEDTYQPPFRSCVSEGRASGMMCSYNEVNGVPTCADYNLMTKTARNSWGFDGYIASDCDAVSDIFVTHKYVKTPEDAVVKALKAGLDVECGANNTFVRQYAASAIKQGKLTESDIDRALHNLFSMRMRLGLFNGNPSRLPYGTIPPTRVCSQKHKNLALKAARDGIVLLKNSANLLPLSQSKVTSLGVIGPNSNSTWKLSGSYSGHPCNSITPLQVLQDYVKDTWYIYGCDSNACDSCSTAEAVQLASTVDHVIMFMGLDQSIEREELDRVNLLLPGMQQSLVTSVAKAAKNPVILVLICGSPVDVSFAKYDRNIGGILWAGYPAETGGQAIAEVIFGKHNPGGRLPVTWYPQEFTEVPMTDMRMRADPSTGYPGRTYRFYTGTPVFKFGYGLSYSNYSYEFASPPQGPIYLNKSISLQSSQNYTSYDVTDMEPKDCEKLKFSTTVRVKNHGPMAGRHPLLLFLRRPNVLGGRPMKQLIGLESVHIAAGDEADVDFVINPCAHFSLIAEDGKKLVDEGSHFLLVGDKEHEFSILGQIGGIEISTLNTWKTLLDHSS